MIEIISRLEERYESLSEKLADPEVISNQNTYRELTKEHADLAEIVEKGREYRKILEDIRQDEEILEGESDPELLEVARSDLESLQQRRDSLERALKLLLVPKDPLDDKNAIVEVRAGTGGEEAGLFAADLYRMYVKFAESRRWKVEVLGTSPNATGGFKEVVLGIAGRGAYGAMRHESGVHRVQRVPETEASGRIHTSAATVAVLPEAEEVEMKIDPSDLRIDVYRSSGPGGQSVNTTDSAVRITHVPTGLVVTCQDEKSQLKNKEKAMKVLRARLLDRIRAEQAEKIASSRKAMVGTGDRSAKIRTYNFPQNRVTDHRIGLTLHNLEEILQGNLDPLIQALKLAVAEQKLSSLSEVA